ncbi:hypothetical protein BDK51DRAFT_29413 [Blyttiomyces helicus]|uniref:Uncharacterized protein n=1 Tax=Blyttiomyces helicus TaxID=388810 RepID=A0A4P9WMU6_9FUNG|nr:hypothetical protein BDK51DRAFT_29413 [Blyttiomyces helicus]|eukprot:RKO93008.1 hypothetical protein BDK51DRAFT_29413 [Blyttiomyces helicus]
MNGVHLLFGGVHVEDWGRGRGEAYRVTEASGLSAAKRLVLSGAIARSKGYILVVLPTMGLNGSDSWGGTAAYLHFNRLVPSGALGDRWGRSGGTCGDLRAHTKARGGRKGYEVFLWGESVAGWGCTRGPRRWRMALEGSSGWSDTSLLLRVLETSTGYAMVYTEELRWEEPQNVRLSADCVRRVLEGCLRVVTAGVGVKWMKRSLKGGDLVLDAGGLGGGLHGWHRCLLLWWGFGWGGGWLGSTYISYKSSAGVEGGGAIGGALRWSVGSVSEYLGGLLLIEGGAGSHIKDFTTHGVDPSFMGGVPFGEGVLDVLNEPFIEGGASI